MTKYHVELSLILFGKYKSACVKKKKEMLSFLPMSNNSVTTGLGFLLLSILAITLSKTIKLLRFLIGLYYSVFL